MSATCGPAALDGLWVVLATSVLIMGGTFIAVKNLYTASGRALFRRERRIDKRRAELIDMGYNFYESKVTAEAELAAQKQETVAILHALGLKP